MPDPRRCKLPELTSENLPKLVQPETKGEVTGSTPEELKGEIMGTVYKETFTKPLPAGAKIIVRKGQRLAEWKDAKGKTRTAPLTAAGDRIAVEAGTYTAKYRDGSGIVRKWRPAAGMNRPPGRYSASWNAGPNWSKAKCLPPPKTR